MKHADTYSALWDKEMPDGSGGSFESYVEEIGKPGAWCGWFEIRALTRMCDIRTTC